MTKRRFTPAYPAELRERGVRLFRENRADYASDTAAYRAIAPKLGCSPDSLRAWCQQAERDSGQRVGRYGTKSGTFNNIMEVFPDPQFYDYTKHYKRMFRSRPGNYHLTFSMSESNAAQAMNVVGAGMNVAVIVAGKAETFNGYPMIDGDEHDLRFLDPEGVFVGLSPKGQLRKERRSEFIHVPEAA